jgi:hypothetical protein
VNHYQSVEIHLEDIKTEDGHFLRDKSIGNLLIGRSVSGIKMARARSRLFCGTAGTCSCNAKGDGQEKKIEALSTKVQHRGGPICMSVEAAVMAAEQRDRRGRPSG